MQEGQAALAGTHENDDFVKVLQTLTLVQPHKAVSQKEMLKLPRPTRLLVSALGGLKHLNSCRFLIAKDLLGFYVMILAQTAGNPMAIRQLRRDCVAPPIAQRFKPNPVGKASSVARTRWEFPHEPPLVGTFIGKSTRHTQREFAARRPTRARRLLILVPKKWARLITHISVISPTPRCFHREAQPTKIRFQTTTPYGCQPHTPRNWRH